MKNQKDAFKEIAKDLGEKNRPKLLLELISEQKLSYNIHNNYCFFTYNEQHRGWEYDASINPYYKGKNVFFTSKQDIKEFRKWLVYYSNEDQSPEERKRFGKTKSEYFKIVRLTEII